MLLVSALVLSSASYAWLILSASPEVSAVDTNIAANGALEIALGKNIGEASVGDSFAKAEVTRANRTWGNLVDLTDESYGLQQITLRPAILNSAGGAVNTLHPLAIPVYGADGRVERIYGSNVFAGTYNEGFFVTAAQEYGVRGIGASAYAAPGVVDTFGPLSQRQDVYYEAYNKLWDDPIEDLHDDLSYSTRNVLTAYCYYGQGVAASDFDLNAFAQKVDRLVSAANEKLRSFFAIMASTDTTPSQMYFEAMALLGETNPDYESITPLVQSAIQTVGVNTAAAIGELRAFQAAAAQLKAVMASGAIDGSDGYSAEEIAQTVGLIFDLDKTVISAETEGYDYYYSKPVPEFYSQAYHFFSEKGEDRWSVSNPLSWNWFDSDRNDPDASVSYQGPAILDLIYSTKFNYANVGQDNDSRAATLVSIDTHLRAIYDSLPAHMDTLNLAVAGLYRSHWEYWDGYAEEYPLLQKESADLNTQIRELEAALGALPAEEASQQRSTLEAQLQEKTAALEAAENRMQEIRDGETYPAEDERIETIRQVMADSMEILREYTLWCIAYNACDGRISDDAYHRIQEIMKNPESVHPRALYQTLCNYGVTPDSDIGEMVAAYETLEKVPLFLQQKAGDASAVTWSKLDEELQRVFGTITHELWASYCVTDSEGHSHWYFTDIYTPENSSAPTEVMNQIRENVIRQGSAYCHKITCQEESFWAQTLRLFHPNHSFYGVDFYFEGYFYDGYDGSGVWEGVPFEMSYSMWFITDAETLTALSAQIGVGTEDNFNESGLTVRQTRFQTAQENISYYQNQLVTGSVNADKSMVNLLMDLIAGKSSVSLETISDYLSALQQQVDYAQEMMYQATLALAASNYAQDYAYGRAYSDNNAPQNAAEMAELLRDTDFDEKVLAALEHRMALLEQQKAMLSQSQTLLKAYQDPDTGALTAEQISASEAAALLNPVLDTSGLTLYGYVAEAPAQNTGSGNNAAPRYVRTVLYEGYGSAPVQIQGKKATIGGNTTTLFGDVYLRLERSLSGSLLALAKQQVEMDTPVDGSVTAEELTGAEQGANRRSYAIGEGDAMFILNLRTMDAPYALASDLWTYTGNTENISANQTLVDVYGYCIDLSFRTNAVNSDLLLQTQGINRIYNDGQALTDTAMGAGSYMEFTIESSNYTLDMAKEYMKCLRIAIADTNTGYIYAYAALDMNAAEVAGFTIKAPVRLYNKYTGAMLPADSAQRICSLEQNLEKNLTAYVYLDGAQTNSSIVSAYDNRSMNGILNLQFSSSADLKPAVMEDLR